MVAVRCWYCGSVSDYAAYMQLYQLPKLRQWDVTPGIAALCWVRRGDVPCKFQEQTPQSLHSAHMPCHPPSTLILLLQLYDIRFKFSASHPTLLNTKNRRIRSCDPGPKVSNELHASGKGAIKPIGIEPLRFCDDAVTLSMIGWVQGFLENGGQSGTDAVVSGLRGGGIGHGDDGGHVL